TTLPASYLVHSQYHSALFFFNVSAPPVIYPLSLHDALPISSPCAATATAVRAWSTCSAVANRFGSNGSSRCKVSSDCFSCAVARSEEHTSELQSPCNLVCRLLLEKKKIQVMLMPAIRESTST